MKQCGNCEFWDRDKTQESNQYEGKCFSVCSNEKTDILLTYDFDGNDCPVYKERINTA